MHYSAKGPGYPSSQLHKGLRISALAAESRSEPIMLFKLPIMLLSNVLKFFPIMLQLCSFKPNYVP